MAAQNPLSALLDAITAAPRKDRRRMVALVGAPASGKSTLSALIASHLTQRGCAAQVVPMDGFHMANPVLEGRDMLHRKGAPETFDVAGFDSLLARAAQPGEVLYPVFDRDLDAGIVAGGVLAADTDTVIVEGNYLLLKEPGWAELARFWDFSVALDVPMPVLRQRLIERWLQHGLDESAAVKRAETNDIPNAARVLEGSGPADMVLSAVA